MSFRAPRAAVTVAVSASLAAALFACGGNKGRDDAGCPPNPAVGDLPADVSAVLQAKCQPCHQNPPKNHAPFPLTTYEDTVAPYGLTGEPRWMRMQQVIQPGSVPHMPYGNAPQLTDAEFQTLNAWFAACAPPIPEGSGTDVGESGSDAGMGDAGLDAGIAEDGGGMDGSTDSGSADGGAG